MQGTALSMMVIFERIGRFLTSSNTCLNKGFLQQLVQNHISDARNSIGTPIARSILILAGLLAELHKSRLTPENTSELCWARAGCSGTGDCVHCLSLRLERALGQALHLFQKTYSRGGIFR